MKKITRIFLILLVVLPIKALAHPLDISSSTYTIHEKKVDAVTYFHSYEAERLLRENKINLNTSEDYYNNSKIFEEYVKKRAVFSNNNQKCSIQNIALIHKEMYEILSEGLGIEYSFDCPDTIANITIELDFFTEYELQTNRLRLYAQGGNTSQITPIVYKVLNPLIKSYSYNLSEAKQQTLVDTDGDEIPDEEERIYKTDPKKIDTDGDYYTDYEEVTMGWNPIKKDISPGQTVRTQMPKELLTPTDGISQIKTTNEYDNRYIKQTNLLDTGFGNTQLRETLKVITEAFKKPTTHSLLYIFLLVTLLGFIHAMGPGHSKSLLVSYIIDKDKGFAQGLLFVTIFSFVHLADIIFLFLITKLFFSLYDPTEYMVIIQRISVIILFIFSLYTLWKSIAQRKAKIIPTKTKDVKGGILLAFVAGLAPCSFGWSIFLILFSLGKTFWIIPLLSALALGIWSCLFLVLVISIFLKKKIYSQFKMVSTYSSIASSSILVLLSIYLFSILFS